MKIKILLLPVVMLIILVVIILIQKSNNLDEETGTGTSNDLIGLNSNLLEIENLTDLKNLGFTEVPEGLLLDNLSGQKIIVNDFRDYSNVVKNDSFAPESYFFENIEYQDQFSIFFYGDSAKFQVAIVTDEIDMALVNLKQYLTDTLGISTNEVCFLKLNIATVYTPLMPEDLVGQNFKLPGC